MRRSSVTALLSLFFVFFSAANLQAQASKDKIIGTDQPSRYYLGKDEQMLLPVNILGMVQKPGQYMVPFRTDLISLIAYAGGFSEDAKINEIKIVRHTGGNESSNGDEYAQVFTVDMKKYFETGDKSQVPQLQPDDTIIVPATATRTINKVFAFISNLAIIAQIAFYIAVIR